MIDLARPGDVRDVDHAIEAFFQLDESAVAGEVANLAFDASAGRKFLQSFLPRVGFELANAERNLLFLAIDAEHRGLDFLIDFEDVRRLGDPLGPRKFGDVDEPFDTGFQFHESAVRNKVDDLAFDLHADLVLRFDVFPRILQLLLQSKANAFFLAVDVEHHHVDFLANFEDFRRMPDSAPAHIGDMEQAVETVEIDECAEIGDVLDRALADIPRSHFREQLRPALVPLLLDQFAP